MIELEVVTLVPKMEANNTYFPPPTVFTKMLGLTQADHIPLRRVEISRPSLGSKLIGGISSSLQMYLLSNERTFNFRKRNAIFSFETTVFDSYDDTWVHAVYPYLKLCCLSGLQDFGRMTGGLGGSNLILWADNCNLKEIALIIIQGNTGGGA